MPNVTFIKGMSSVIIPINILDDDMFENITETFTVALSTEVDRVEFLDNAIITITDNDSENMLCMQKNVIEIYSEYRYHYWIRFSEICGE